MGVLTIPIVLGLVLLVLQLEWIGRKRAAAWPSGWLDFIRLLSKRTSRDPAATALAFAVFSVGSFALWEGLLRAALDLNGPDWRWAPGLVGLVAGVALRRARPARCHAEDVLLLLFAFQCLLAAWFTLPGLLWVGYRARHLPRSWPAKTRF